jgi:hypothetical protein
MAQELGDGVTAQSCVVAALARLGCKQDASGGQYDDLVAVQVDR